MDTYPRLLYAVPPPLGLYLRPGRNDHRPLLQLLSEDTSSLSGVVFNPCLEGRQEELRKDAHRLGLETVLDPLTIELGTPGGFTKGVAALAWGGDQPHDPTSLSGPRGLALSADLAQYVKAKLFSSVLAPTHFITDCSDPWMNVDRRLTENLRQSLDMAGLGNVPIYYPLAIPGAVFRSPEQRKLLVKSLASLPIDAIWLRVHPFGTSSSGPTALRGYIEACRALHYLGLPIVAERTGALGVALLAFGAVGGIESGVTSGEQFDASRLLRPRITGKPFLPAPRVYLTDLGTLLSRKQARQFFENRQMKSMFACRQETCCPRGALDMVSNPRRHFLNSRLREVTRLSRAPASIRPNLYMEEFLRPATDRILKAVRVEPSLETVRRRLESWRYTLGSVIRSQPARSFSVAPEGRRIQQRRGA